SDEIGQRDVAAIKGGDLDLREPDTQVQVPGLGAAASLEQVNDVGRLVLIEADVNTQPVPPVQPRILRRVDELPSVDGAAAEAAHGGIKVCYLQRDDLRRLVVPPAHAHRARDPAYQVDRD